MDEGYMAIWPGPSAAVDDPFAFMTTDSAWEKVNATLAKANVNLGKLPALSETETESKKDNFSGKEPRHLLILAMNETFPVKKKNQSLNSHIQTMFQVSLGYLLFRSNFISQQSTTLQHLLLPGRTRRTPFIAQKWRKILQPVFLV